MYSLYGYRQEPHLTETVESQARRQLEWPLPQERSLASHREASAALEERTPVNCLIFLFTSTTFNRTQG